MTESKVDFEAPHIEQKSPSIDHLISTNDENFGSEKYVDKVSSESDEFPDNEDITILKVLSKSDCNANGTVNEIGVAKMKTKTWNQQSYKCSNCKMVFTGVYPFQEHYKLKHPNNKIKYTCFDRECLRKYNNYPKFASHYRTVHEPILRYW